MISIIKKAFITLTRKSAKGQCSHMGSTAPYEAIHPYGYYALPESGSMVLLLSILGDESNKLGIEYDNKKIKSILAKLGPGDNAMYNPTSGSHIIFRKTGDIEVLASGGGKLNIEAGSDFTGDMAITGNVTITGNVNVTGNIIATGNVTAVDVTASGTLSGGGDDMNVHTHDAGSYNIGGTPVTGVSGTIS